MEIAEIVYMQEIQNPKDKIPNNVQIQKTKLQTGQKIYDLRERLLRFARRGLQICRILPKIPECDVIRRQLSKSVTSIGANYEEADGALTRKDFVNKAGISRKEAKETRYWLKVIMGNYLGEAELAADLKEAEELISILSAILIKCGAKIKT